jgi:hypothetical protein
LAGELEQKRTGDWDNHYLGRRLPSVVGMTGTLSASSFLLFFFSSFLLFFFSSFLLFFFSSFLLFFFSSFLLFFFSSSLLLSSVWFYILVIRITGAARLSSGHDICFTLSPPASGSPRLSN